MSTIFLIATLPFLVSYSSQGPIYVGRWDDRHSPRAAGREREADQKDQRAARSSREGEGRRGRFDAEEQHRTNCQGGGPEEATG